MYTLLTTHGYPELYVSIVDENEETVEKIKKILQDADFDMYVHFSWKSVNATDDYDEFPQISLGEYVPAKVPEPPKRE